MGIAIAFLSGKGGSGKTTLALSMADLLSRCGMKTLLVDCDMSTNGATYFYESQLSSKSKNEQFKLCSFQTLLYSDDHPSEKNVLDLGAGLSFIPSIVEISGKYLKEETVSDRRNLELNILALLDWAYHSYDVVLFDCQAGYTEILPALLPLMDVDLFILEADSISGSAMRSLHLKIGNWLGNARLYQIFNKATPEEFDIYSKIVGTFFINIGTLLFDWKIRQAFSRSRIPDIENTSAKFGLDLCDICKIILPDEDAQKKFERFSAQIIYQRLREERKQVETELYNISTSRFPITFLLGSTIFPTLVVSFVIALISYLLLDLDWFILKKIVPMIFIMALSIYFFISKDDSKKDRRERQKYERRLKELDKELKKVSDQLQDSMSD